jgi:hypothetical protein
MNARIAGISAENRIEHHTNRSLSSYCYINLLGQNPVAMHVCETRLRQWGVNRNTQQLATVPLALLVSLFSAKLLAFTSDLLPYFPKSF